MSIEAPAPEQAPPLRKKRMTVFDAMDGALARVKGLDEAAAKAKTLPFTLHSEEPSHYGKSLEKKQDNYKKEQYNRTRQQIRTTEQDNEVGQKGSGTGQWGEEAEQGSRTREQNNRAVQSGCTIGQDKRAGQKGRTEEQGKGAPQLRNSEPPRDYIPVLLDSPAPARTPAQRRVLGYFENHGSHVSNYDKIITETGLPYNTVRKGIDKLIAAGCLSKTRWSQGSARGLLFTYHGQTGQFNRAPQQDNPIGQYAEAGQKGRAIGQDNKVGQKDTPLKERDRKNLSISLETVQTSWPTLARAGFGLEQLEQIQAALAQLGKSADRIIQGLDHAEWELAAGKMCDKAGQPVVDPCAWVFRSLASQGYYRRPAGYLSAEEQAEIDAKVRAEEMERALTRARESARQERFRAWEQGLSWDERKKALEGRRGPEEVWLKNAWAKLGEP